MKPSIRPYKKEDRIECLEAFKSNFPLYFTENEVDDFDNFLSKLEAISINGNIDRTYYYVVIFEEKVIGCGGFGDKENENILSLAWGLIHKDYHKKGFGKELLLYRLEQIKKLNLNIPLVIDTTQFSYPFFEKFGFKVTKITNDFYAKEMHRYDMLFKP